MQIILYADHTVCRSYCMQIILYADHTVCRSYEAVSNAVNDKLVCVKLEFFCLVASILLPFLTNYQSDKPLVPFLAADLAEIIRCLMKRFLKSEIIDTANTCEKLCGIAC